jgi:thiol-disulfide isomerase/thioredoxin
MPQARWTRLAALIVAASAYTVGRAGVVLDPQPAPEWKVSEWLNRDPGTLAGLRGKTVLIHFFQLWCPGCNEFSIPLFKSWEEQFGTRDDVAIVSIHTVFEGHDVQTPAALRAFVAEKGITYPVGLDAYPTPGAPVPVTMERFDTGGTPHVVIVDRDGLLRFSHFGRFDPEPVERFITRLLEERRDAKVKAVPLEERRAMARAAERPGPRGGQRPDRRRPAPEPERAPEEPLPEEPLPPDPDTPVEDPAPGMAGDPTGDPVPDAGEAPAEGEAEPAERAPDGDGPDPSLSGSFRLRFEPLSNTCGDPGPPVEVITQLIIAQDRLMAKFSRPYLGLRELTATFDPGANAFSADLQQQAPDKAGAAMELSLRVNGRFVSIVDPVTVEYDYLLDRRGGDEGQDCMIEGRGSGSRLRAR